MVSHWKQLNLPINNEKLMNLGDPGLLLLPNRIWLSALLYVAFHLISYLCLMFCALCLTFSLALSLVGFLFSLRYSKFARFSFYIVSLDKQLYVKLVANQYRCLVWCCWVSYTLYLLFCLLLCLLPYLLLDFFSPLDVVDLLVFFSAL